jgi:4-amino-4-deoxy-L-arabinose transferase-like glycosyltransferase
MTATLEQQEHVQTPRPTLAERFRQGPSKSIGRVRRRSAWFYSVLALVVVVVVVQGWNITGFPAIGDDEGTYLAQAWAIQHGEGLAHYTYWYDHPPFGWMQIAALSWIPAMLWSGFLAVAHARLIMLVVSAVNVVLLCTLARRIGFARWSALLAGGLFALSPLAVTLQRQIYLDNFAVMWMLAAFVLALSPRRHLWHHVAAGGAAALAVLSKETMILVLPALVVAMWQGSHPSTRKFCLVGIGTALLLVCGVYPLYALLKGELLPGPGHVSLVGGMLFQFSRPGSGSILIPGTGSNGVFQSWLYYDPVLIFAGIPAVLAGLAFRRLRAPAVAGTILVLVALRPNGYLPGMYIIQALPFFALAVGGLLEYGAKFALTFRNNVVWRIRYVRRGVVVALALGLAAYVVPQWGAGDGQAMTIQANGNYRAAAEWIRTELPDPQHSRIVVDDAIWLDMVNAGFQPGLGAIWFYKLDRDSGVIAKLPGTWRAVDYIVSSPIMRQALKDQPNVSAALTHSRVLATFGAGDARIEIRKVLGNAP